MRIETLVVQSPKTFSSAFHPYNVFCLQYKYFSQLKGLVPVPANCNNNYERKLYEGYLIAKK